MLSVSKRIDLHHHLPYNNSSSPIKEEIPTKQGIVTILLRSDCEKNNKFPPSIRRTLSADMSSKKWLQQNGFEFSSPKQLTSCSHDNINNNNHNSFSSESECDKRPGHDEVWRSIHQLVNKEKNDAQKTKSSADDVWGSLVLTQKTENSLLTPPYVHPLVKRSKSALSEKSLEICTENLGSETGSDGFPSYPSSDAEEEDKEGHKNRILELTKESSNPFDNLHVAKYRVAPSRPIPPPLPSISAAASLHMESRRENGRLVLEAVSVRPKKCFHAQRQDGRLVLTLINSPPKENKEEEEEDFANVFDKMEELEEDRDDGYEEEEKNEDDNNVNVEKEVDIFMEQQNARSLPSGIINLHKTGLLMKKLMASKNKSPTSTYYKFNQAVRMMENEEITVVPQSLPPRPPVGRLIPSPPQTVAAASFNRYEYFWRNKDTVMTTPANSIPLKFNYNNRINGTKTDEQHQDKVFIEEQQQQNKAAAATEYFVPYLRGCYETKRSVSMWEPYCIATS